MSDADARVNLVEILQDSDGTFNVTIDSLPHGRRSVDVQGVPDMEMALKFARGELAYLNMMRSPYGSQYGRGF